MASPWLTQILFPLVRKPEQPPLTMGSYQLSGLEANDTVKITNIAYSLILISVKELLQTDTIFLEEKMLSLDKVVINQF